MAFRERDFPLVTLCLPHFSHAENVDATTSILTGVHRRGVMLIRRKYVWFHLHLSMHCTVDMEQCRVNLSQIYILGQRKKKYWSLCSDRWSIAPNHISSLRRKISWTFLCDDNQGQNQRQTMSHSAKGRNNIFKEGPLCDNNIHCYIYHRVFNKM